jgi:hypothetical protein
MMDEISFKIKSEIEGQTIKRKKNNDSILKLI